MKFCPNNVLKISLSSFTILLLYYYYDSIMIDKKMHPFNTIYKILSKITYGHESFIMKNPGCSIPNYGNNLKFPIPQKLNGVCGPRAVSVKRIGNDKVVFQIDKKNLEKYAKKNSKVQCCYRFGTRVPERDYFVYSKCTPFQSGKKFKLLQEVIRITCTAKINKKDSQTVYDDKYIILKKIKEKKKQSKGKSWNVLVLGMSTMSRVRMYNTMPLTIQYLQTNKWLDYKGYHKVGNSYFFNLMTLLTDNNTTSSNQICSTKSRKCNEIFIWKQFKDAGYATFFGDDYFNLPNSITKNIFEPPSTDHYVWPFFLMKYQHQKDNVYCTKNAPSGKQLLDYGYQFVDAYKTNNFFGMFWINTFSGRIESIPSLIDADVVNFFKNINESGILKNTFVMLLSDHGITAGDIKTQIESYYEERLPMFFMWVPNEFQKLHMKEFQNASINQNRPISAYDLHFTLVDILKFSQNSNVTTSPSCPRYTGLFREMSPQRECADAGIDDNMCACRDMKNVDGHKVEDCINLIVDYIQNKIEHIKTIPCMKCVKLHLKSVIRSHMYIYKHNKYYVVAIQMTPSDISYEATVLDDGNELRILLPVITLSRYGRGHCALDPNDRIFCLCDITVCGRESISSLYTKT